MSGEEKLMASEDSSVVIFPVFDGTTYSKNSALVSLELILIITTGTYKGIRLFLKIKS